MAWPVKKAEFYTFWRKPAIRSLGDLILIAFIFSVSLLLWHVQKKLQPLLFHLFSYPFCLNVTCNDVIHLSVGELASFLKNCPAKGYQIQIASPS